MSIFEEKIKPSLENRENFAELDAQTLVDCAKEEGKKISDKKESIKTQTRKFYNAVKQIERQTFRIEEREKLPEEVVAQLLFIRPHLANAASKNRELNQLKDVLDVCLNPDSIEIKADLTRFVKFFEAIVAYSG